jgi:hypothetical protein
VMMLVIHFAQFGNVNYFRKLRKVKH